MSDVTVSKCPKSSEVVWRKRDLEENEHKGVGSGRRVYMAGNRVYDWQAVGIGGLYYYKCCNLSSKLGRSRLQKFGIRVEFG